MTELETVYSYEDAQMAHDVLDTLEEAQARAAPTPPAGGPRGRR